MNIFFSIPEFCCEYTPTYNNTLPKWLNASHNFGLSNLKNHNCWLNCGTRGNVWELPCSTGFILWAPWILWWRSILEIAPSHDTNQQDSHKCGNVLFSPPFKSHFCAWEYKQNMADEACGEQRGKQVEPQSFLNVSQGSFSLFQSLKTWAVCSVMMEGKL